MNTQTHLLLACAVLVPATVKSLSHRSNPATLSLTLFALAGALLPDASIFVMWGVAKFQGVAESVIWGEWYFSPFWQSLGAISNSFPLYFLLAVLAYAAGGRYRLPESAVVAVEPRQKRIGLAHLVLVFASAAILHVIADFPLHHDDGHPHFWPLTQWIFRSPVSYWDPAHYGRIWSVIEVVFALIMITILWRRFDNRGVKGLLVFVAISYAVVTGYWLLAF